ncbi:MAG: FtsX-like permease family protein [Bacillota bacterium]
MTALYGLLARRYLLARKGRTLITVAGIALGVTMVVAVMLTNQAILSSYENLLAGAAGRADLQLSAVAGNGFPERLLAEAERVEGIETAVPVVASSAPVEADGRRGSATFYGIDPARDGQVREHRLSAGRLPAAGGEVAVSHDLAEGLGVGLGHRLRLLTVRGFEEFTVVGLFDARGTVRGALGPFGLMELRAAQAVFGREGRLDLIDLLLAEGAEADAVRERLSRRLGDAVRVGTPVERAGQMQRLLDSLTFVLTLAGSISLFAGAFMIFTNVSMGVSERRRELSILRAVGMRRFEVVGLVLAEAGAQGLLGSLLGLGSGYGLARAMAEQMTAQFLAVYHLQVATVTLTGSAVVTGLAVGLVTALAAALAPAWETVRVSPVEAMRPDPHAEPEGAGPAWRRVAAGLVLIAAGLVVYGLTWPSEGLIPPQTLRLWGILQVVIFLGLVLLLPVLLPPVIRRLLRPWLTAGLGVTGRLAADNLLRRPARTSATAASLIVSLAFMVGIGGVTASQLAAFTSWYEKVIGWDMNVSSSFVGLAAQVEMDPSFVAELARVEGVRLVSPQKMHGATLTDGQPVFIQALDHRLLRQYSETPLEEGDWEQAADRMEEGGGVIISPAVARRLGAGVGMTIGLPTPVGIRPFEVVGIMQDVTPYGGTIQLDRGDYLRYWQDPTATNIAVLVEEGVDPAVVKERILQRWGESMGLKVRLNQEFWAELRGQYDAVYRLLDGLIWISVLVAGLALANTLFAAALERRREIGLLRAIGVRQGEVIRLVAGEALGIGLFGGALGLMAGFGVAGLMVPALEFVNGAGTEWTVDGEAVLSALLVSLLLAPLVGLLPARWAARLDVVDALRYE